jgi:hypothetical protein
MLGFFQENKSPSTEVQTLKSLEEKIEAFRQMSPEVQANASPYLSYLLSRVKQLNTSGKENVTPQSPDLMTRSLSCTR